MYNLITKLSLSKQLRFEEGRILLFGKPTIILPAECFLSLTEDVGNYEALYEKGKILGKELYFAPHLNLVEDEKKALILLIQLFNVLGFGKLRIGEIKFDEKRAIFTLENSIFGISKSIGGCYYISGIIAGFMSEVFGEDTECIERECIKRGSPRCEFVVMTKTSKSKY